MEYDNKIELLIPTSTSTSDKTKSRFLNGNS